MKNVLLISVSLVSLVIAACATTQGAAQDRPGVERLIASWPATPKEVAGKMIEKYGLPNEVAATMLIWHKNGPWKRSIVYRDEVPHDFPKSHTDLLEQFIDYRIPLDRYDDLARYDGSVLVQRTNGEMSARCDKEEMNFLALNLANDVATGRRTVDEARRFYAETVMAVMRGEKPPYIRGFQFEVPRAGTADPDQPMIPASQ